MQLAEIQLLNDDYSNEQILNIAASLEFGSEHPIARAIQQAADMNEVIATEVSNLPGQGVTGRVAGHKWYLGSQAFIKENSMANNLQTVTEHRSTVVWLANEQHAVACIYLLDRLRAGALSLIQTLQSQDIKVSIISGDNEIAVQTLANDLAVDDYQSQALPADKLQYINELQNNNKIIAMLGDGVNDAPVLAKAQVSIAMGGGSQLASVSADMVLLSDRLERLIDALVVVKKTMRIVKQNITWALIYNLCAIPAAAMGYVPPWLAAIGMSASSLVVVGNSLRILKCAEIMPKL